MRTGLIAKKLGMTRIFTEDGSHVPVTVLQVDHCQVVAVRTEEKDGYTAVQLGVGKAKVKNVTQPMRGHYAKAKVEPKAEAGRVPRLARCADRGRRRTVGDAFRRRPVRRRHRHDHRPRLRRRHAGGTISAACARPTASRSRTAATARPASARIRARCSRTRRWPAITAPSGVTTQNLRIVSADDERGLIMVEGAVPGAPGGYVLVKDAAKRKPPQDLPFPAALARARRCGARRSRRRMR